MYKFRIFNYDRIRAIIDYALNKNNPLITIIIPVYNAEKLIAGCIESIIQQNVEYWNLILVNDGSSDKSGKYVKNMLNKTVASL